MENLVFILHRHELLAGGANSNLHTVAEFSVDREPQDTKGRNVKRRGQCGTSNHAHCAAGGYSRHTIPTARVQGQPLPNT